VERDWREGPSPESYHEKGRELELPALSLEAAIRAIARYLAASAWVAAEEAADAERGPGPGRVERARIELDAATAGLWWAIRSQFAGRDDGVAIGLDLATFVAAGSPESPQIVTLLHGRTHSTFSAPTRPSSPYGNGLGGLFSAT
jgi:hypothetical protein